MTRHLTALALALALLCGLAAAQEQPDPLALDEVELKNGKSFRGSIFKEDPDVIFLRLENGEQIAIARTRVKRVVKAADFKKQPPGERPAVEAPPAAVPEHVAPPPKAFPIQAPVVPQEEVQAIFGQLKDLGDPLRDKRMAALERAKELGFRAVPVLLAVFDPKQNHAPELKIGALRALAELGPLDMQGAHTLAFAAMKDPNLEVRREAARTIRLLKEDRGIEWLLQFAVRDNKAYLVPAALALKEINDDRAFATLASVVPAPTVNAAMPQEGASNVRRVDLPVGPGGAKMPVFLSDSEVVGTAENVGSPPADALKIISGKDLGSTPGVWINWINEKTGLLSEEERKEAYKNRSLINRMGDPQVQR